VRVEKLEEEQVGRVVTMTEEKMKAAMVGGMNRLLDAADDGMWDKLRKIYIGVLEKSKEELGLALRNGGFGGGEERVVEKQTELEERGVKCVKDRMKEKKEHLLYTMEKKFNEVFRMDDRGLPRRWKPGDNVAGKFGESRKVGMRVLDLYSIIRLDPEWSGMSYMKEEPDSVPTGEKGVAVLSLDEFAMLSERFKKDTDAAYLEAIRDQENAGALTRIPTPMIALLVILGFNEFWMLLTNPLLLILAIIVGVAGYFLYILGFAEVPLRVVNQVTQQLLASLRNYVVASAVRQVVGDRGAKSETKKD